MIIKKSVEKHFSKMIKAIRKKNHQHDYSMLTTEDHFFLPTDLSLMMQYLYKKNYQNELKSGIIFNQIENIKTKSNIEIGNQIEDDYNRFIKLLSITDDSDFEQRLRKIYHISLIETKFRRDQSPLRRQHLNLFKKVSKYF